MKNNIFIQNIYILSLALTLPLHVFNFGGEEGLKPFHITAVLSLVLSFFLVPSTGKLHKNLMLFLIVALFSSIISYSNTAIPGWVKIFVVVYSCYGLSYVDVTKLTKWLLLFIPIDLMLLVALAIIEPQYRFQGFYNDPNYLCVTLIVFMYICCITYNNSNIKSIKIIQIINIIVILGIILLTLSRTGFLCCLLILFILFYSSLRKNIFKTFLAIVLLVPLVSYYASDFIDEHIADLYDRSYGEKTNLDSSTDERLELSLQNIYFIIDNPQYIIFGLGVGTTQEIGANQVPGLAKYRKNAIRDHNTWTSCFSEHGIIALILFLQMFILTIRNILRRKSSLVRNLTIGTLMSLLLFSLSIYQTNYLPFWWWFFLINNSQIYNYENFAHSTNRTSRRRNWFSLG